MTFLTKENQEKLKIITTLTQVEDAISYEELLERASLTLSRYTLSKHLQELKEKITILYPDDVVNLDVTTQTVYLKGSALPLNLLIEGICKEDSYYKILTNLLKHESLKTDEFSYAIGISFSTLRRYVKEINQQLIPYELKITLSQHMRLVGKKNNLIFFTYCYLYRVHHQFQRVPNLPEKNGFSV